MWLLLTLALIAGCATRPLPRGDRPFVFSRDTFAFANALVWEYGIDTDGRWRSRRREPAPDYTHHCFVVARAAKQFFEHARFDDRLPKIEDTEYRQIVREIMRRSPRAASASAERVVVPGFADLRSFSAAHERLLKKTCGAACESYFQRGHWRIVFPFGRAHRSAMALQLADAIRANHPPVIHAVRFPQLTINHALVVFDVSATPAGMDFHVYDPNNPAAPVTLRFDQAAATFELPRNDYFIGGRVDVYEVYHRWCY